MASLPTLSKADLKTAIYSLDVTLESELALFRRQISHPTDFGPAAMPDLPTEATPEANSPGRSTLIQEVETTRAGMSETPPVEAERSSGEDMPLTVDWTESFRPAVRVSGDNSPDLDLTPAPETEIGAAHLIDNEESSYYPSAVPPAPRHASAIVLSNPQMADSIDLDESAIEPYYDPSMADYLESSEALLEQLDTPLPEKGLEDADTLKWFGIAAIATLVLSLSGVFFLKELFPARSRPESPAPSISLPPTANPSPQASGNPRPSSTPTGPNLAEPEFGSINSSNLSQLSPTLAPVPASSTTAPAPAAASPAPPAPITAASSKEYYVVTDYNGEDSLKNAQKIVPAAKLEKFTSGDKIQLGKFNDLDAAKAQSDQLTQKGLAITILETE